MTKNNKNKNYQILIKNRKQKIDENRLKKNFFFLI